jgi:hypothetical protein
MGPAAGAATHRDRPALSIEAPALARSVPRVTLGAAAESLVLAAYAAGVEVLSSVSVADGSVVATFELGAEVPNEGHDFDSLAAHPESRRTDRRQGDQSALSLPLWEDLQVAARSVSGVELGC